MSIFVWVFLTRALVGKSKDAIHWNCHLALDDLIHEGESGFSPPLD